MMFCLKGVPSLTSKTLPKACTMLVVSTRDFSNRIHNNFSFPKHGELFSQENLGEHDDEYITDDEELGALRRYRAPRNIRAQDIMTDDFRKVRQNMQQQIQDTYSVDTMSDTQAMEHTKNLIARMKSGRNMNKSLGESFKKTRLQSEYLNHRKYEENFVEREDVINPDLPVRERLHIRNYRDATFMNYIKNSDRELKVEKHIAQQAAKETSRDFYPDRFLKTWEDKQRDAN